MLWGEKKRELSYAERGLGRKERVVSREKGHVKLRVGGDWA
jgi:hypothetical protein